MPTTLAQSFAVALAVFGALLLASVLLSRAAERTGLPLSLLFLGIGMLAGREGLGGIVFDDYGWAFRIGSLALALILFDGGLNTPVRTVRTVFGPAVTLATVGVLLTGGILAGLAHLLGLPWPVALLVGAVVSSTDAAAVFSVLRGAGINLRRRVGQTLELESGLNDPLAVILTTVVTEWAIGGVAAKPMAVVTDMLVQAALGSAFGLAIGHGARWMLGRVPLRAGGLYPAFTLAVACLAWALPTLVGGSGFLAVFLAGLVLGHGELPFRTSILRVHDAVAWLAQIVMFLVLGLLVAPSRLLEAAGPGLALALLLMGVARPTAVAACLAPFRYRWKEVGYVGWVGLRGAVPIILATVPVLAGVTGAETVFDLVFFIVVTNVLVQSATAPWLTRRLALGAADPPAPSAVLSIETREPFTSDVQSYFVDDLLPVAGARLADVPLPARTSVMLVVRDRDLVAPAPEVTLATGDHVYLLVHPDDRDAVQLLFGRAESD